MKLVELKVVTKPRSDRHHWRKVDGGIEECANCLWLREVCSNARTYRLATWPVERGWEAYTRAPCCGPVPDPTPCGNRTCGKQVEHTGGRPQAYCSSECRKAEQAKRPAGPRSTKRAAAMLAEIRSSNAWTLSLLEESRALRASCLRAWA